MMDRDWGTCGPVSSDGACSSDSSQADSSSDSTLDRYFESRSNDVCRSQSSSTEAESGEISAGIFQNADGIGSLSSSPVATLQAGDRTSVVPMSETKRDSGQICATGGLSVTVPAGGIVSAGASTPSVSVCYDPGSGEVAVRGCLPGVSIGTGVGVKVFDATYQTGGISSDLFSTSFEGSAGAWGAAGVGLKANATAAFGGGSDQSAHGGPDFSGGAEVGLTVGFGMVAEAGVTGCATINVNRVIELFE